MPNLRGEVPVPFYDEMVNDAEMDYTGQPGHTAATLWLTGADAQRYDEWRGRSARLEHGAKYLTDRYNGDPEGCVRRAGISERAYTQLMDGIDRVRYELANKQYLWDHADRDCYEQDPRSGVWLPPKVKRRTCTPRILNLQTRLAWIKSREQQLLAFERRYDGWCRKSAPRAPSIPQPRGTSNTLRGLPMQAQRGSMQLGDVKTETMVGNSPAISRAAQTLAKMISEQATWFRTHLAPSEQVRAAMKANPEVMAVWTARAKGFLKAWEYNRNTLTQQNLRSIGGLLYDELVKTWKSGRLNAALLAQTLMDAGAQGIAIDWNLRYFQRASLGEKPPAETYTPVRISTVPTSQLALKGMRLGEVALEDAFSAARRFREVTQTLHGIHKDLAAQYLAQASACAIPSNILFDLDTYLAGWAAQYDTWDEMWDITLAWNINMVSPLFEEWRARTEKWSDLLSIYCQRAALIRDQVPGGNLPSVPSPPLPPTDAGAFNTWVGLAAGIAILAVGYGVYRAG